MLPVEQRLALKLHNRHRMRQHRTMVHHRIDLNGVMDAVGAVAMNDTVIVMIIVDAVDISCWGDFVLRVDHLEWKRVYLKNPLIGLTHRMNGTDHTQWT